MSITDLSAGPRFVQGNAGADTLSGTLTAGEVMSHRPGCDRNGNRYTRRERVRQTTRSGGLRRDKKTLGRGFLYQDEIPANRPWRPRMQSWLNSLNSHDWEEGASELPSKDEVDIDRGLHQRSDDISNCADVPGGGVLGAETAIPTTNADDQEKCLGTVKLEMKSNSGEEAKAKFPTLESGDAVVND
jgi:hypothetical protein